MSHFPNKNYFTMPNEIFSLELDASEIAVYGARRTGAALRPVVSHLAALPHGQYLPGQRSGSRCHRRPNRPQAAGAVAAKARRPRSQAGRS